METLSDEEILLSLTQVLRRVTGIEQACAARAPPGPVGVVSLRGQSSLLSGVTRVLISEELK